MHPYQRGRALIAGLRFELRKIIETGRLIGVAVARLVCAQHGRSPNGVQVPCVKIEMNRNEQISTSRSQGGTGDRVAERRLCECPKGRDSGNYENAELSRTDGAQRSQTRKSMDKNPIQGRSGLVSWHNTATAKAAIAAPE